MSSAVIIGDGPAGLSAALFLAKNGCITHVLGVDKTPNHKALLMNYLGIERITGTEFQRIARSQVERFGAQIHTGAIADIESTADGFRVVADDGSAYEGKYLILAAGAKTPLLSKLGVTTDERGFALSDRNGVTNVENVYAVGWSARPDKVQAIISAGDGAAAALDILSREKGKAFHDFDTPQSLGIAEIQASF